MHRLNLCGHPLIRAISVSAMPYDPQCHMIQQQQVAAVNAAAMLGHGKLDHFFEFCFLYQTFFEYFRQTIFQQDWPRRACSTRQRCQ